MGDINGAKKEIKKYILSNFILFLIIILFVVVLLYFCLDRFISTIIFLLILTLLIFILSENQEAALLLFITSVLILSPQVIDEAKIYFLSEPNVSLTFTRNTPVSGNEYFYDADRIRIKDVRAIIGYNQKKVLVYETINSSNPQRNETIRAVLPDGRSCESCTYYGLTINNAGKRNVSNIVVEGYLPTNDFYYEETDARIIKNEGQGTQMQGSFHFEIPFMHVGEKPIMISIRTDESESVRFNCHVEGKPCDVSMYDVKIFNIWENNTFVFSDELGNHDIVLPSVCYGELKTFFLNPNTLNFEEAAGELETKLIKG